MLLLLPSSKSKLMAQWQGPYRVVKQVGKVNYLVDMHNRRKRKRVFHVYMLRRWHEQQQDSMVAEEMKPSESEFEDLISGWSASETSITEPSIGD